MKVLITGGAGYIGSTVASACLDSGITPVVLDDYSLGRREFTVGRIAYEGDIADGAVIDQIWAEHPDIDAVIHCAAFISVPDSVTDPLTYYDNNVGKSVSLFSHLVRNGCSRVIFSSSGSIYAKAEDLTVTEASPLAPMSPYATTKAMMEQVLRDAGAAGLIRSILLRYFNPIGADPQVRTGQQVQNPGSVTGKLLTAQHEGIAFKVTGTEYETRDGTAIRDYIHVWDLALAHVRAVQCFDDVVATEPAGSVVINLGTGLGTTVREYVEAFREVAGELLVEDAPPRPGDARGCYTASTRAKDLLAWQTERSIADGIRDALAWDAKRMSVLGF